MRLGPVGFTTRYATRVDSYLHLRIQEDFDEIREKTGMTERNLKERLELRELKLKELKKKRKQ
jgi:hypothetical protein